VRAIKREKEREKKREREKERKRKERERKRKERVKGFTTDFCLDFSFLARILVNSLSNHTPPMKFYNTRALRCYPGK